MPTRAQKSTTSHVVFLHVVLTTALAWLDLLGRREGLVAASAWTSPLQTVLLQHSEGESGEELLEQLNTLFLHSSRLLGGRDVVHLDLLSPKSPTLPEAPTSTKSIEAWASAAMVWLNTQVQQQNPAQVRRASNPAPTDPAKLAAKSRGSGSGLRRRLLTSSVPVNTALSGDINPGGGASNNDTADANSSSGLSSGDASTSSGLALPVMRRVLMAQLVQLWLTDLGRQMPQSPHVSAELSRLVGKMYELHVDSVASRAAMEYFHISKAGGTSWTSAAKVNGCTIPRGRGARVPLFDDDNRWLNRTVLMEPPISLDTKAAKRAPWGRYGKIERRSHITSCKQRYDYARAEGYEYVSNEYTLHGAGGGADQQQQEPPEGQEQQRFGAGLPGNTGPANSSGVYRAHLCPQFVNVLNVREPGHRLLSNVRFMLPWLQRYVYPAKVNASNVHRFRELFCDAPAELWEQLTPPIADNYNVRSFLGEQGFHTPLWGIGAEHVAVAQSLLLQFDLVLDLNSGDTASDLVMRQGLGWNATLAEIHSLDSNNRDPALDCAAGNLTSLLERQEPDRQWYSFARTVSRLDQAFLAMARVLGRQPVPSTELAGGVVLPQSYGGRCGLLGRAADREMRLEASHSDGYEAGSDQDEEEKEEQEVVDETATED